MSTSNSIALRKSWKIQTKRWSDVRKNQITRR